VRRGIGDSVRTTRARVADPGVEKMRCNIMGLDQNLHIWWVRGTDAAENAI
jgi:hypothetical protein